MSKNIIFCSDGTWQHQNEPKASQDTNIAKLPALIDQTTQVVIYEDGVGVEFPEVLGGALGVGLFGKVKQGYAQLAAVYQPGDRLWFFGFSRGAFTARALAGMVSILGLPTKLPSGDPKETSEEVAEKAFAAYQTVLLRDELKKALVPFAPEIPAIAMQGMFDTVGSLGITGALFGIKDPLLYGFLDTNLHPNTETAYHSLAIDERRLEFKPTLWHSTVAPHQVLVQVWFTGVHSEIGGGTEEIGLSNITLGWMLKNAEARGLALTPAADQYRTVDPGSALIPMKDSWSILWAFPERRAIPDHSTIANSTAIRLADDATYRPSNLRLDADGTLNAEYTIESVIAKPTLAQGIEIPANASQFDTHIDIQAGKTYSFAASGIWVDKNPPGVTADGVQHPGFPRDAVGFLKKMHQAPWMALIGRVNSGDWFLIGSHATFSNLPAGRLYCCANDAPGFYGNNHGTLRLDVDVVPAAAAARA